jgi:hypothetical protein
MFAIPFWIFKSLSYCFIILGKKMILTFKDTVISWITCQMIWWKSYNNLSKYIICIVMSSGSKNMLYWQFDYSDFWTSLWRKISILHILEEQDSLEMKIESRNNLLWSQSKKLTRNGKEENEEINLRKMEIEQ